MPVRHPVLHRVQRTENYQPSKTRNHGHEPNPNLRPIYYAVFPPPWPPIPAHHTQRTKTNYRLQFHAVSQCVLHPISWQPGLWLHRQTQYMPTPQAPILWLHIHPVYQTKNVVGPHCLGPELHARYYRFQLHSQIYQNQIHGKFLSHLKLKSGCVNPVYRTHISTSHHQMKCAEFPDTHLHLVQKSAPFLAIPPRLRPGYPASQQKTFPNLIDKILTNGLHVNLRHENTAQFGNNGQNQKPVTIV